ncbi:hypothetical protein [Pelagicoccus mobilis]|uniref:DUF4405 domain-containing protein n=1 Tax=Pelagicoccus mobilis TaxID=415221 RepID=A0A934VS38_9BACT|nr:hypothetical protein [Pelagicoccus mobilis]MBK1880042.1 hypothetical protein [Pelagicoccus mobilis]
MSRKRSTVSLFVAFSFIVLAVSGVLAFVLPFSIRIVGLHALIGFAFVALIGFHVFNNFRQLSTYLKSRTAWAALVATLIWVAVFLWQPAPVRSVLRLSCNMGPALDRFEVNEVGMRYQYVPDPRYRMDLNVRKGPSFDGNQPPEFAIWLENASQYHIKTLRAPEGASSHLPYWHFKRSGWEEAKREAEASDKDLAGELEVDAISGATQNSSFDPADYIVPDKTEESLPYRLLIEIDQPNDDQASLVYGVDIDNASPRSYQLLDLVGYPRKEENDAEGKKEWALYYVDGSFDSALNLIDSALLTIERGPEDD